MEVIAENFFCVGFMHDGHAARIAQHFIRALSHTMAFTRLTHFDFTGAGNPEPLLSAAFSF